MAMNAVTLLENLQVFKIQGRDKRGRKILRIVANFFPEKMLNGEVLKGYLQDKICPKLGSQPFTIVYFHSVDNNLPLISTLRQICDAFPTGVKENIQSVHVVHPGLQSRLFLATFGRFIFSGGLYGKLNYVTRLEYLWDQMRRSEIEVPEIVKEHDEKLEYRPLMDYGLESDHPRVYGGAPAVSAYSMRCIA